MGPITHFRNTLSLFFSTHVSTHTFSRMFLGTARLGIATLFLTTVVCAAENRSDYARKQWPPHITLAPPDSQEDETVTDLYVYRHGETDSNVGKLLSGGGDTEAALTDEGQQQVRDLAAKISRQGLKLPVTYTSDLLRAVQTATPLSPTLITAPQLREILHGKYERTPAKVRSEKASLVFKNELDTLESAHKNIGEGIHNGTVDRFHFWKIHPM